MLFRSAIFATLAAAVTASFGADTMITPQNDFNIPADSKIGRKLMEKARFLEGNNQVNAEDWLYGFSIRYDSCASLIQIREEGGNNDEGLLYTQNMVKFTLCPGSSDGCSGCGSGAATYVVNMNDFVDAYTEMKLEAQEYACEMIREYCYCENANDDQVCENQCYTDAGMDVCIEYEGGDEFEIQRYLECAEMEGGNGNNNNNNQNGYYNQNNGGVDMYRQYWVGPTCSEKDGKSIHMRVFYDAGCTTQAPTGVYEAFHYGAALPFETTSIVTHSDCVSCLKVDQNANNNNNNNNNNQNQNMETNELCKESYEMAAKCGSGGSSAATAFAVIFAITSLILGAYAFFLYRKIHRAKVNLAQAELGVA
ncbi:hypothetical protein IV203_016235 [Nitzschia inconspicua]|uniref:Uncharacterized protein n=1 Tax=Nitzschia inconspicua TaxID=303405 RepID=A0A9K3K895_9STRA|nr:hypothetical protein IV203_017450 [Nitzschia inconspicua]KAG7347530.1 hypothetical protein IV203_016235 [Nitzschia inconspicua]